MENESLALIIKELNKIVYPDDTLKFHNALEEFKNFITEVDLLQQENDVLKERIKLLESCESSSQVNWRLNCEIFKLQGENNRLKLELDKIKNQSNV